MSLLIGASSPRALGALRGWGLVDNGSKPVKRPSLFGGIGGRRRRTRYREAGGIASNFFVYFITRFVGNETASSKTRPEINARYRGFLCRTR